MALALAEIPLAERDAWIDARLGIEPPPPDEALPRGAVPYLPCGVAEILAAIDGAPITAADVVVDVGAGLGRVLLVVALATGARGVGVELQGHLVARGRAIAAAHGAAVELVHANAAEWPLPADATVVFLYAPCNGELLARVLERIAERARVRPLVVCAVDVAALAEVPWLVAREARGSSGSLAIYDTRS